MKKKKYVNSGTVSMAPAAEQDWHCASHFCSTPTSYLFNDSLFNYHCCSYHVVIISVGSFEEEDVFYVLKNLSMHNMFQSIVITDNNLLLMADTDSLTDNFTFAF